MLTRQQTGELALAKGRDLRIIFSDCRVLEARVLDVIRTDGPLEIALQELRALVPPYPSFPNDHVMIVSENDLQSFQSAKDA